jgi:hypothetical protein
MHKLMRGAAAGAVLFTAAACAADKFALFRPDLKAGQSISEKHYWNNVGCSGTNITPIDGGIHGGKLPAEAREGNTDLGKPVFFGPCPPVGRKHHSIDTVYALKSDQLHIPPDATAAMTGFFLWQNTIAKSRFTVTARQQPALANK